MDRFVTKEKEKREEAEEEEGTATPPEPKRKRGVPLEELFAVPDDAEVTTELLHTRAARLVEALLTRCLLHIGRSAQFFITELELYYRDDKAWPDPFTHGDEMQLTAARWYFHRSGSAYKGGTYKGLDITCGVARTGTYGGLLIRGLRELGGGGSVIDGPCLCVDRILAANKAATIADFVSKCLPAGERDTSVLDSSAQALWIEDLGHPHAAGPGRLFCTPRYGLTLKAKGCSAATNKLKEEYLYARLRAVTTKTCSKKGRAHALLSLLMCDGATPESAARDTGSRINDSRAAADRAKAALEAAKALGADPRARFAAFYGKDTPRDDWETLFAVAHICGLDRPLIPTAEP